MRVVQLRTLVGVDHNPVVAGHNPGVVGRSLVVEEHNPVEQVEDSKPEEQKEDLEAPSPSPAASTRKIPYRKNCPFAFFYLCAHHSLFSVWTNHCTVLHCDGTDISCCVAGWQAPTISFLER